MAITRPLFAGDDPTPASVKRRQLLAEQLLADNSGVQQISHPLQAVAQVLGAGVGSHLQRRADRDEATGMQSRRDASLRIADSYIGSGSPSFGSSAMPSAAAARAPSTPSRTASLPSGERAGYIRQGLVNRGLPEHVADGFLANFHDESGLEPGINERNPIVPGSRGGFGLYQLTGPRRREYEAFAGQRGVDPSDIDAQLDFMMTELQGSERRAGERILGSRDTASAAQAIVNDFLRPSPEHRQSRSARYAGLSGQARPSYAAGAVLPDRVNVYDENGLRTVDAAEYSRQARATHARPDNVVPYSGPGASIDNNSPVHDEDGFRMQTGADRSRYGRGGVQVASLDPREAMASALGAQPVSVSPANQALGAALTGGGSSPATMQPQSPQASPAPDMTAMAAQMTGGQQPQPAQGVNRALIAELLGNPWTEDMGQQLLMQQIETQQRNSDPLRQLQIQQAQLELERARNPQTEYDFVNVGGNLFRTDPRTGTAQSVYQAPADAPEGFSLSEGQMRFDANGNQIAVNPGQNEQFREATPEEASARGAQAGQFGPDGRFYPLNPPSGMSIQSDGQGGFRLSQGPGATNAVLTEGQSKDAVFSTRAEGALPLIDQYETTLTSRTDAALGAVPLGLGRDYQSTEFQLAQQAGDEFLQAILRKDTGAAITEQEQALYGNTYLPRPGDSPELIAQKRQSRSRALEAIKAGMPPAAIVQQEIALRNSGSDPTEPQSSAPTAVPAVPEPMVSGAGGSSIGRALPMVRSDEEYDALPPGGQFYDPQGNLRTKPNG